mmetsp:Transcript_19467/g.44272  ORF Transcript_19467/g.44272 Transcript_19467/m.44272 type:complete len:218 (+) Transcript_19467:249-902(+)
MSPNAGDLHDALNQVVDQDAGTQDDQNDQQYHSHVLEVFAEAQAVKGQVAEVHIHEDLDDEGPSSQRAGAHRAQRQVIHHRAGQETRVRVSQQKGRHKPKDHHCGQEGARADRHVTQYPQPDLEQGTAGASALILQPETLVAGPAVGHCPRNQALHAPMVKAAAVHPLHGATATARCQELVVVLQGIIQAETAHTRLKRHLCCLCRRLCRRLCGIAH